MGRQSGKVFLSATHRLVKDRENFVITALKKDIGKQEYFISRNLKAIEDPLKMQFTVTNLKAGTEIPKAPNIACFDLDKLKFPLKIRRWQKGDHFYPFGMKGKKKLSDFYTDKKFSLVDKENVWLLCNGDHIIWVIGHRNDNRYRITGKTKRMFRVDVDTRHALYV
jgi:tRNA(Ile)-lysidine synthase